MGQTNEEFDPELNELQFYWDKADTLGIVKIALDEGKPAAALYLAHYWWRNNNSSLVDCIRRNAEDWERSMDGRNR